MPVTYIQAINQAMNEEMARDENVMLLGEDVGILGGAFKATEGLLEKFGSERVVDTPISESLIVGAGVGLAIQGMRPVLEMQFIDFISCGFDQIVNMAATLRYRHGGQTDCPIVIRGPCGAGVHGGLYHSQNPEAWFFHVPGLKVVAPATAYDAKGLLKAAIRDDDPVIYLEHKFLYRRIKEDLPEEEYLVPIGKAALRKEGRDVTVITYGSPVHAVMKAARDMASEVDIEGRHRSDRPANAAPARLEDDPGIGEEDRKGAHHPRGAPHRRDRRGDRGANRLGSLRASRRAGDATGLEGYAQRICGPDGGVHHPQPGEGDGSDTAACRLLKGE
jgi:pyruvate/2-oxoglutarate/acetoin dehydrogenase E1 component